MIIALYNKSFRYVHCNVTRIKLFHNTGKWQYCLNSRQITEKTLRVPLHPRRKIIFKRSELQGLGETDAEGLALALTLLGAR